MQALGEKSHRRKNHAALLENGKRHFLDAGMFPSKLVRDSLAALVNTNTELKTILRQKKGDDPPSGGAALYPALKLEELAGEIHFQHTLQQALQKLSKFPELERILPIGYAAT